MAKHIVTVSKGGKNFRIVIPRDVVRLKRWQGVRYVLVEDHHDDKIVIRRLLDEGSLKSED